MIATYPWFRKDLENLRRDFESLGRETVRLASDTELDAFALAVLSSTGGREDQRAALGLGLNSSLLAGLKEQGSIGSRSWSYWHGLAGADAQSRRDGGLTLGGYDRAKIRSDARSHTGTVQVNGNCTSGALVSVAELILTFPNGTTFNLMGGSAGLANSEPFSACLCANCPWVMTMPQDPFFERFERYTNTRSVNRSEGINWHTMQYTPDRVFGGDLTIGLDSGFRAIIPNDQLVLPDRTIDNATGAIESDESVRNLMIFALNANDMPQLGQLFFTAAMLAMNHDKGQFTLFETNPSNDIDLVAISADGSESAGTSGTPNSPGMPGTSSSPDSGSNGDSGQSIPGDSGGSSLTTGAIVGVVIGCAAAIALVAAMIFWFRRRRASREASPQQRAELDTAMEPQEMPAAAQPVEMPSATRAELGDHVDLLKR